jgi:subtilisin family serine protease
VVDTGIVLPAHPWIKGHLVEQFEEDDVAPRSREVQGEFHGHGTCVAGLIAREAPTSRIRMFGALRSEEPDDDAVAQAIMDLAKIHDVELVNLSFGGHVFEFGVPPGIEAALASLDRRVVVVAAAGNSGSGRKAFPAAIDPDRMHARMIAVGAASGTGPLVAEFSNHGRWVHCYADGEKILAPYLSDGWALWSGTSMAAAIVTGRIARVRAEHPNLTTREAAERVLRGPQILVWGVNGPQPRPYVARGA